jgi:dTDP-4-dehydrorhamnose reductase
MKVLILGGSGMLGHKLWQRLAGHCDVHVTLRRPARPYEQLGIFDSARTHGNVSAQDLHSVMSAFVEVRPDVVVNCIGIVKQDPAAKDPHASISINALFPHRLATLCGASGVRLIHLSTDCVFSGLKGYYREADTPDPHDLYGRTKLLGEVDNENCLTIRTSMIGRELSGAHGLVEWFLTQKNRRVSGFKRAVFSGFTTNALSDIIAEVIFTHTELSGIWHVAAEPISKFDLLTLLKQSYGLDTEIEADETFACDRSLDGSRFQTATGHVPPSWPEMVKRMHQDSTPYAELRRIHA